MIIGPDLSHHNDDTAPVNFDLLAGHIDFAISKITQGTNYVDPRGAWHVSETRRIGAIPGLYHFPDWGNAVSEAEWFAQHAGDVTGAFIAFDCEAIPGGIDPVAWSLAFCATARDLLGVLPLIYMNKSTLSKYNWSPLVAANFGLWEANYDGNPSDFSNTGAWPAVALKQFTDAASLNGITGAADEDSFNGTRAQLLAYCKPGTPAPPSPPAPPVTPPTPPPAPPGSLLPTLTYGMRDNASVAHLQRYLANAFPAYKAKHGALPATGNYLDVTAAWVLEFQTRCGIKNADGSAPDGKTVGHNTNANLWRYGYRG